MDFFNGTVVEAINQVKANNSLLFVLVEGAENDEKTVSMIEQLNDLKATFKDNQILALCLKFGSPDARMFAQVYPVLFTPMAYLIHGSGNIVAAYPLTIMIEELKDKIEEFHRFKEEQQVSGNQMKSEEKQPENSGKQPGSAGKQPGSAGNQQGGVVNQPGSTENQPGSAVKQPESEEKEKKVIEKPIVTQEQQIASSKPKIVSKTTTENKSATEKSTSTSASTIPTPTPITTPAPTTTSTTPTTTSTTPIPTPTPTPTTSPSTHTTPSTHTLPTPTPTPTTTTQKRTKKITKKTPKPEPVVEKPKPREIPTTSRIIFRFEDDSKLRNTFSAQSPLNELATYVEKERPDIGKFHIISTYPCHIYTEEEKAKTILELDLCPSSILVIKRIKDSTTSGIGGSGTGSLLSAIFNLPMLLLGLIQSIFVSFGLMSGENPKISDKKNDQASSSSSSLGRPGSRQPKSNSQGVRRRENNIYGLDLDNDADDERKTFNGNSTNQY